MNSKTIGQVVAALAVLIAFGIPWVVGVITIVQRVLD